MNHPLENYRSIAGPDFITRVEDKFYSVYHDELLKGLHVETEKDKDRMYVNGFDMDGNPFDGHVTFSSYILSEYSKLEKECRLEIDNFVLTILDESKQKAFINNITALLQELRNTINNLPVEPRHEAYQLLLLERVDAFTKGIQNVYQQEKFQALPPSTTLSSKKLRWLGNTNILTTLFYDLINGVKSSNIPQLIDSTPKEIELFIINNFIDKDGKDFDLKSTINTNLKPSKQSTKRALDGDRIDLSSYYKPE